MNARDNGGPAFPLSFYDADGDRLTNSGMTLRDYFAAKAMQGYLAAPDCGLDMEEVAAFSYKMAGHMLAAREAADAAEHAAMQDADGWIEWKGGEQPVSLETLVNIKTRCGAVAQMLAWECDWRHNGDNTDIIAYRVVQEGGAA